MPAGAIRIDRRFRGPPHSGNGGYVAGMLAREAGGSDVEVTLLKPPPLDRDLTVARDGASTLLLDGETAIASAVPRPAEIDPPPPPSFERAAAAAAGFAGFTRHTFPGCFVCGPERGEGDGLRIFPGALGDGTVAAPWTPSPDLCGADGVVLREFLWAALDCPGYFAVQANAGAAMLGRVAVHIEEDVRCGEVLVVLGWPLESSGRKHRAGTALYSGDRRIAAAVATWISIPPPG